MTSYERNGVTVDQCADCRGIFLDRGELQRLVDSEAAWQAASAQPQPQYQQPRPQYQPPQYGGGQASGYPKRRKSFLENLFD